MPRAVPTTAPSTSKLTAPGGDQEMAKPAFPGRCRAARVRHRRSSSETGPVPLSNASWPTSTSVSPSSISAVASGETARSRAPEKPAKAPMTRERCQHRGHRPADATEEALRLGRALHGALQVPPPASEASRQEAPERLPRRCGRREAALSPFGRGARSSR